MKKLITLLASLALVASGLHILPAAAAEEPPAIPASVNIEDPVDDANYLNDQGLLTEFQGDNATPRDASTLGDILKVWFTNDATTVSAHIQTQAAIPDNGQNAAIFHRIQVDPDGAGETCLWFQGGTSGLTNAVGPVANLRDTCGDADEVLGDGELKMEVGPEETGIITITVPRSLHPALGPGGKLLTPKAETRNYWSTPARSATAPQIDNTKPGTDYLMVEGGPTVKTPPGKSNPPGKKLGCAKGKGKKRGCEGKGKKSPKPGKPSAACAPFTPGEAGAEKPTVVLTDAATEAAPVEQTIALDPSIGDADLVGAGGVVGAPPPIAGAHNAFNIQVDPAAAEAGLYALIEFPARNDYDLNLLHPDGSYAARSRAFNPFIELNDQETPFGAISVTGHGGEATAGSEKLVGIRTADCGGWTLDVANYLGQGGDMVVKLWLGEVKNDPQEEGAETP